MPQFNPSSFCSQLFWLAVCFGIIYFSMKKIFLPRIRDLLIDRHNNVSQNHFLASQTQSQIDEITIDSKNLRENSLSSYKLSIDQSLKDAALRKELGLADLKLQTSRMIEESKTEIARFKQDSQGDCIKIINQLVDDISNKLFESKTN